MSECYHYDEGYDDGYADAESDMKKKPMQTAERTYDYLENEVRYAIRAIKHQQPTLAISCLQRAFGHDIAIVELIETEWRAK